MTIQELKDFIQQGEGYNLEFKEALDKNFAKEVCAFTNANGGKILLGVSDDGAIKGVSMTNSFKSQVQHVARMADPAIDLSLTQVGQVLVIDVKEGPDKPYAVGGKYFLRQGPNSQQLKRDEIRDFFQSEGKTLFDEKIAKNFDVKKDLSRSALKIFREEAGINARVKQEQLFDNLRITSRGRLKNAGVLMFAKDVTGIITHATITCALFQGKDKVKILDRKEFSRDVYSNYQDAMVYLKSHLNTEFIIKGGPREEILELPEDALRETILNAIAHRNYFLTGGIHIYIFADRVEIVSPGGLVKGMSKKDLGKKSLSRNQLLFGLMQRMDLVEEIGSGILRIKQAMKEYKLPAPKIVVEDDWFTVIYKRPELQQNAFQGREEVLDSTQKTAQKTTQKITQKITQKQKLILDYLRANPGAGRKEISNNIQGITVDGVKYSLKVLQEKEIIKRVGPAKGGHWEIVKNLE